MLCCPSPPCKSSIFHQCSTAYKHEYRYFWLHDAVEYYNCPYSTFFFIPLHACGWRFLNGELLKEQWETENGN